MKNKWIAHGTNREQAEVNLILFTYAGGSPSIFAPWKRLFDEQINLCPVLYPGRELRRQEAIPDKAEDLAKQFVDDNPELFEKDYVLFGHCTGNILSYEVAKYAYRKLKKMPKLFIASGSNSPRHSVYGEILKDENGVDVSDRVLAERMVDVGIVTADFIDNQNFIDYYMPIYRSDVKMLGIFDKDDVMKLDCEIYVLYGREDEYVDEDGLKDWSVYTTKGVQAETFEGAHFYITTQKEALIGKIVGKIERTENER
ncbi:MAG: hypothetical protein K6G01_06820 [Eubacterium sp.]|nr:hypothetical protein [Eubacterium sp.]